MKDSDVMAALISKYGLESDVSATTVEHEAIVQFDATDWDTHADPAEMNGMLVTIDAGKVRVKPPETSGAAAWKSHTASRSIDLRAELDAVSQTAASAIKSFAWDSATQALIESGSASADRHRGGQCVVRHARQGPRHEQLHARDRRASSRRTI